MYNITQIKPQGQKIIFQFIDDANAKGFSNTTSWNFEVKTHEHNAQSPRWGKVILTGTTVKGIESGDYVLIEPLMWTHGFTVEEVKYWATDFVKVIGSLKEEPTGIF